MESLSQKIMALGQEKNGEEKIEQLLETMLKEDPTNVELWLRLAILELDGPFHDEPRSMDCLEKVLAIDPNNIIATLLLAYIHDYCFGKIDLELKQKLSSLQTNDPELNAMIQYALSWFYSGKDDIENEKLSLQRSIDFYPNHTWNYKHLAQIYFEQNQYTEAKKLIEKALKNVVKVYAPASSYDPTDANEFINERIKGIFLSSSNFNWLKELLLKIENQLA